MGILNHSLPNNAVTKAVDALQKRLEGSEDELKAYLQQVVKKGS